MKISSSILSCSDRKKSILKLNSTTVNFIHFDVMDGKFVSDSQFSLEELQKLISISTKKVEIHLMTVDPVFYISRLNYFDHITYVTFHLELDCDLHSIIRAIRKRGYQVGIAIHPDTPIENIFPYLSEIDLVLVMSVVPGKGGQVFQEDSLERIACLRQEITRCHYSVVIEVDGGIKDHNIHLIQEKGADIAVVGSYIVSSDDYQERIDRLHG